MRDLPRLKWAALAAGSLCLFPAPVASALAAAPTAKPVPHNGAGNPADNQDDKVVPFAEAVAAAVASDADAEAAELAAARATRLADAGSNSEAAVGGPDEADAGEANERAERAERARQRRAESAPLSDVVGDALGPGTPDARRVANWVVASNDNGERPFLVIDKVAAAVFVFDAHGEYLGETPALLGITAGDDATPGVGDKSLSEMGPEEKTTPAGRFAARMGPTPDGQQVLWVDYATSVALHPIVPGTRRERRAQRMRSVTPEDNRITFGCINVPTAFFRNIIRPLFRPDGGIVYILPETRSVEETFPSVRVAAQGWGRR